MMTEREEVLVNAMGNHWMDTYDEFIDYLWEIVNISTEEQVKSLVFAKIQELQYQKELERSQATEFIEEVTA